MTAQSTSTSSNTLRFLPWIIFGIAAAFYCYEFLLRVLPSVAVSELSTFFSINAKQMGVLSATYYSAYVPMQLLVGILLDRYSTKWLLILACTLCALGTAGFVFTDSTTVASIARFAIGFGSAFAYVGTLKVATIWLAPRHFPVIVGVTNALGMVGAMIADVILTPVVETLGVTQAFYYCAFAGFILAGLMLLLLSSAAPPGYQKHRHHERVQFRVLLRFLCSLRFWVIGVVGGLLYLPQTVFNALWGPSFFEHVYGLSPSQAGSAVSFMLIGFIISSPISGKLGEKYGFKKGQLVLGNAVAALASAAMILLPSLIHPVLYGVTLIIGLAFGLQVQAFVLAKESVPLKLAATALAVTNMIIMLGGLLFQPLVGELIDWVGAMHSGQTDAMAIAYQQAMLILPIGLLIGALLALTINPGKKLFQKA